MAPSQGMMRGNNWDRSWPVKGNRKKAPATLGRPAHSESGGEAPRIYPMQLAGGTIWGI